MLKLFEREKYFERQFDYLDIDQGPLENELTSTKRCNFKFFPSIQTFSQARIRDLLCNLKLNHSLIFECYLHTKSEQFKIVR